MWSICRIVLKERVFYLTGRVTSVVYWISTKNNKKWWNENKVACVQMCVYMFQVPQHQNQEKSIKNGSLFFSNTHTLFYLCTFFRLPQIPSKWILPFLLFPFIVIYDSNALDLPSLPLSKANSKTSPEKWRRQCAVHIWWRCPCHSPTLFVTVLAPLWLACPINYMICCCWYFCLFLCSSA